MGERLYVTGHKMIDMGVCGVRSKTVSKTHCFGKLYYYANMHEMRSADFLAGVIAGVVMNEALIDRVQYDKTTDIEYLENEEGLYSWQYQGDYNELSLTKSMMKHFARLFIEDKAKFNICPFSKEEEKALFEFIEEYDYFTLEHGG